MCVCVCVSLPFCLPKNVTKWIVKKNINAIVLIINTLWMWMYAYMVWKLTQFLSSLQFKMCTTFEWMWLVASSIATRTFPHCKKRNGNVSERKETAVAATIITMIANNKHITWTAVAVTATVTVTVMVTSTSIL